ncbi:MAG: hypothetical protein JST04_12250 [Bdellovibrionales bacterium]|nr:hypothetical protein [Bdellovibrionales bacterium]
MFGLFLLATSLLASPAHSEVDSTLRPIRNEKCEMTETEARTVIEARLAEGTALCGKGNSAKQIGGWSCKHSGCAKGQYKCVTQYSCAEGTLTLSLPGKSAPSGTPTPPAGSRVEPQAVPNAKFTGGPSSNDKLLPKAERRDIPNGNQVFVEEKGVDANGVPSAKVYDPKKGVPNDLKVYGAPSASPVPTPVTTPVPTPVTTPVTTPSSAVPPPAPAAPSPAESPTAVDKAAAAAAAPAIDALQKSSDALNQLDKE